MLRAVRGFALTMATLTVINAAQAQQPTPVQQSTQYAPSTVQSGQPGAVVPGYTQQNPYPQMVQPVAPRTNYNPPQMVQPYYTRPQYQPTNEPTYRPGLFARWMELERRKNAWLRATFLGR